MTHRQAPASKTVHHLLYVLDLRRRSEAMADEPSPLLELGRIPETDSVVFDRLPAHEQPVAARLLDGAPQLHAVAALRPFEDRRGLFHRGFEFRFQAGLDLDLRDFGDHPCLHSLPAMRATLSREAQRRSPKARRPAMPSRLLLWGRCAMWARGAQSRAQSTRAGMRWAGLQDAPS